MLAIRTGRIDFPSAAGSQTRSQMVWFPTSQFRECWVGLSGYRVAYTSGDHEVKTIDVGVRCQQQTSEFGPGVQVSATLFLSDRNADDAFNGWVDFILFVELLTLPPISPKVLELKLAFQ